MNTWMDVLKVLVTTAGMAVIFAWFVGAVFRIARKYIP